jgi:hypothetical protein
MLQGMIFPILDPDRRKNGKTCSNATKHNVGSSPFS